MYRTFSVLTLCFLAYGLSLVGETTWFLLRAEKVTATVIPTDPYRGPPRSPRSIPISLSFLTKENSKAVVTIPSPYFKKLAPESTAPLLVDPTNLNNARFAFLPDLWAFPAGITLGALVILLVTTAARRVKPHSFPPSVQSAVAEGQL